MAWRTLTLLIAPPAGLVLRGMYSTQPLGLVVNWFLTVGSVDSLVRSATGGSRFSDRSASPVSIACVAASAVEPSETSIRSTHALRNESSLGSQLGLRTNAIDLPG